MKKYEKVINELIKSYGFEQDKSLGNRYWLVICDYTVRVYFDFFKFKEQYTMGVYMKIQHRDGQTLNFKEKTSSNKFNEYINTGCKNISELNEEFNEDGDLFFRLQNHIENVIEIAETEPKKHITKDNFRRRYLTCYNREHVNSFLEQARWHEALSHETLYFHFCDYVADKNVKSIQLP